MSSKVRDGLFLGDVDAAQDEKFIELNRIQYIINCSVGDLPNVFQHFGIQYLSFDMQDEPESNLFDLDSGKMDEIVNFIDKAMEQSESVLIHCVDGTSLSVCVALAYLMYNYEWCLDKAYEYLSIQQPELRPQSKYIDQLYDLEKQILQRNPKLAQRPRWSEWTEESARVENGERILVNTFLNIQRTKATATNKGMLPQPCSHQRRLSWIDEQKNLPRSSVEMMRCHETFKIRPERPPNACYSSMQVGTGWIDQFAHKYTYNPTKSEQNEKGSTSVKNRVHLKDESFELCDASTNLSMSLKRTSEEEHRDLYSSEISISEPSPDGRDSLNKKTIARHEEEKEEKEDLDERPHRKHSNAWTSPVSSDSETERFDSHSKQERDKSTLASTSDVEDSDIEIDGSPSLPRSKAPAKPSTFQPTSVSSATFQRGPETKTSKHDSSRNTSSLDNRRNRRSSRSYQSSTSSTPSSDHIASLLAKYKLSPSEKKHIINEAPTQLLPSSIKPKSQGMPQSFHVIQAKTTTRFSSPNPKPSRRNIRAAAATSGSTGNNPATAMASLFEINGNGLHHHHPISSFNAVPLLSSNPPRVNSVSQGRSRPASAPHVLLGQPRNGHERNEAGPNMFTSLSSSSVSFSSPNNADADADDRRSEGNILASYLRPTSSSQRKCKPVAVTRRPKSAAPFLR